MDFYRNGRSISFDFIVFVGCFVLYIHLGAMVLEIIRICQSEKGAYEFGVLYFCLVVMEEFLFYKILFPCYALSVKV